MPKITVMQRHIDEGERLCDERCPIALALAGMNYEHPRVGVYSAGYFSGDGSWRRVSLPVEAGQFVLDFDAREPVEPFRFQLDTSDPEETSQ